MTPISLEGDEQENMQNEQHANMHDDNGGNDIDATDHMYDDNGGSEHEDLIGWSWAQRIILEWWSEDMNCKIRALGCRYMYMPFRQSC